MRQRNPLPYAFDQPKNTIIFAASQLRGTRDRQEDYFINYNDECFVLTDGVGGIPHGEVAAKLAAETAIWGYKLIRQRPFYWVDKAKLIRRMIRSTNLTIWQKQREPEFNDGMATTLITLITSTTKFWIGSVGDSRAYLLHEDKLSLLTHDDVDSQGLLTKAVGFQRLGLVPQIIIKRFFVNDTILLASDGLTDGVSEEEIRTALSHAGETTQSVTEVVVELLSTAEQNSPSSMVDNMTAVLVKRVAIQ